METYAFEIAKRLSRNHDVTVLCRVQNQSFNYRKYGLKAKILPLLTGILEVDTQSVLDFLHEYPQDVIHMMNAGFSVSAKRLGMIPVIVTANGKDFLRPWIAPRASVRAGLKNANRILAVSGFVKKKLAKSGIRKNVEVVHHGTDTLLFKPGRKDTGLMKRLGIREERVMLTVSRVTMKKNIEGVISLLPMLKGVKYIVAGPTGEKEYFRELKELAKRLGVADRVKFAGPVKYEKLPKYYRICDVFIMLSAEHGKGDIESFGIAYLEAMACGKPVIASRESGIVEIIRKEKVGIAISPGGQKSSIAKIRKIIYNGSEIKHLGGEGMKLVRKNFSWDIAVQRLSRIYEGAIKERRRKMSA